jgi:tetratricopeptide (TPR) repeat protein
MVRLFALAVILTFGAPILARAEKSSDCIHHKDENVRIKSCSAVISANPTDAVAYYNRAAAYRIRGDSDNAVADYTKAIELKPSYGPAYSERALVHAAKGDYARALADAARANELTKQSKARSVEHSSELSSTSHRRTVAMAGRCGTYTVEPNV